MPNDILEEVRRQRSLSGGGAIAGGTATPGMLEEVQRQRAALRGTPHGDLPMGEPGLDDPGLRMRMSFADTFDEKRTAFRNKFPEGDITIENIRGEPTLLFRKDQNKNWSVLDPSVTEKQEWAADFADLAGATPEVLGEVAALTLFRGLGKPIKAVTEAGRAFLGGGGGKLVEEGVETVTGVQEQGLGEVVGESAQEGALAATGALLTQPVITGTNVIRGAGGMRPSPGSTSLIRAAERQGLPEPMLQQVTSNPILRKMAGQAGATLPRIQDYWISQQQAATRALKRLRGAGGNLGIALRRAEREAHKRLTGRLNEKVAPFDADFAGYSITKGIDEWDELARANIDNLYAEARKIENPVYDPSDLMNTITRLERGAPYQTVEGEIGQAAASMRGELQGVIDKIKEIDWNRADIELDGEVFALTDAVRMLRQQLWDLKTPAPGDIARQSAGHPQAAAVYGELTKMLRNPINKNEAFVKAWRKADTKASERFNTWEKEIVRAAAQTQTPSKLAASIARPLEVDNIRILKGVLPGERWEAVRRYFMSDVLREGGDIGARLNTFDDATLNEILTHQERQTLLRIGEAISQLNSIGITNTLRRQSQQGAIARELLERGDTAGISRLYELASPKERELIRLGLIDNIANDVIQRKADGTIEMINPKQLGATLKKLRQSGAAKFLKRDDYRTLLDLETYARGTSFGADTGTSIQAAEAISGLRELSLSAFHTIAQHVGVGRLMTSPAARKALFGRPGKPPKPYVLVRATGVALGSIVKELQNETQKETTP